MNLSFQTNRSLSTEDERIEAGVTALEMSNVVAISSISLPVFIINITNVVISGL